MLSQQSVLVPFSEVSLILCPSSAGSAVKNLVAEWFLVVFTCWPSGLVCLGYGLQHQQWVEKAQG